MVKREVAVVDKDVTVAVTVDVDVVTTVVVSLNKEE